MYKEIIEKNWKSGNEVIMSKIVKFGGICVQAKKSNHVNDFCIFAL